MNPPPFPHRVERARKPGEQVRLKQQLLDPNVGDRTRGASELTAQRILVPGGDDSRQSHQRDGRVVEDV